MIDKDQNEFKTTSTKVKVGDNIPLPIRPEGEGWALMGQSLEEDKGDLMIAWYWIRKKQDVEEEEEFLVQA